MKPKKDRTSIKYILSELKRTEEWELERIVRDDDVSMCVFNNGTTQEIVLNIFDNAENPMNNCIEFYPGEDKRYELNSVIISFDTLFLFKDLITAINSADDLKPYTRRCKNAV